LYGVIQAGYYTTAGSEGGPNIRRAAAFPDQGIQRQGTSVPLSFFPRLLAINIVLMTNIITVSMTTINSKD
jgi:hypothetical protein